MLVWNLETQEFEELRAWMRYCPWINTPKTLSESFWNEVQK